MKKILSTILASLVSVAFAGLVYAAEPYSTSTPSAQGTPPSGEVSKEKQAPAKKHVKKHRKHRKHAKSHKATTAPKKETGAAPQTMETPASPAPAQQ